MIAVKGLKNEIKDAVTNNIKHNGSVWRQVLINVVQDSGGTVTLQQVYNRMEAKKPTENPFWKEQIRKIIQQSPFERVDNATYKLIA